ncbi:MAG: tRNA 2-thiouridine(34) synthase MnmA [Deltaproteobacteria bacterium]|nr:tRNA 2-thiouridine(34) synthase MnmA [Deltaproteobacteria bacterium]
MSERIRPRWVVGMSGGVDSSVAAALLVEQGAEVIGVTMHLAGSQSRCCSLEDADDARRVADQLGIRFYVANYKDRFREEVILPFADAYLAGRTPIPCVACNRHFKFRHLVERAKALGTAGVATGHYARLALDPETGERRLLRGVDPGKDQSYFLFDLGQEQLRRIAFPLGDLTKDEVREKARELGLATADKPESQEICFVPDGDYARAVEELRPAAIPGAGDIVDGSGRKLGRHGGIHRFTVGQRRGLGLTSAEPRYVCRLDAQTNQVVVGDACDLETKSAWIEEVSWTRGRAPQPGRRAQVKIRHQHPGAEGTLEPGPNGRVRVAFAEPVRAVAPGQAAVFYDGDEVLGGGWIAGSGP